MVHTSRLFLSQLFSRGDVSNLRFARLQWPITAGTNSVIATNPKSLQPARIFISPPVAELSAGGTEESCVAVQDVNQVPGEER